MKNVSDQVTSTENLKQDLIGWIQLKGSTGEFKSVTI